jgi:hypothetical protein
MESTRHGYGLSDLEALTRQKARELGALMGEPLALEWPPGGPRPWEFRDWEIDWFFRAFHEYSLFDGPASRFGSRGLPAGKDDRSDLPWWRSARERSSSTRIGS